MLFWRRWASTRAAAAATVTPPLTPQMKQKVPPFVLHCHFTKNNTKYTLSKRVPRPIPIPQVPAGSGPLILQQHLIEQVRPRQEVVYQMTAGQQGFKGKKKRSPEAAFAATTALFKHMSEPGFLNEPLEIVMHDFGPTRQVFQTVLFGKDGTRIRPYIKRLTDLTKIKFGGDRSRKRPRK